jgi:Zn-dependent protease
MNNIVYYALSALAVLIILPIHEFAHGYAAYKLGDNTAKNLGRLSLNPLRHLDPIGALCMVVFHFGWAKPVPINARNFKYPKRDFAIVAMAGPLANLLLSLLGAFLYLLTLALCRDLVFYETNFLYYLLHFIL